jgi:hypothetical protein
MSPTSGRPPAKSKATVSTAKTSSTTSEDKVGYKHPPKASRFVKGQSGNREGRKKIKKIEDLRLLFEETAFEPVQFHEDGQVRTTTRLEATINALRVKALKGNVKAIRGLLKLTESLGMFAKSHRRSSIKITEPSGDTGKILRMYHAEQEAVQRSEAEFNSRLARKSPSEEDQ